MLSLTRVGREAAALDARLDTQRMQTRALALQLREGLHRRITAPTALVSSFTAGIVAGHLSGTRAMRGDGDDDGKRRGSPLRMALGYGSWALRVYLTQKAARFLGSI
ncbi:MAG TPA: hypothetical protein VM616_04930 [Gammaproteobacteria bacterium]|nr:hypothetical protein [Gammaproteobacteria bacterium]